MKKRCRDLLDIIESQVDSEGLLWSLLVSTIFQSQVTATLLWAAGVRTEELTESCEHFFFQCKLGKQC